MINQERRDDKRHYKVFFFEILNNSIKSISECKSNDQMYQKGKIGFYRRVNVSSSRLGSKAIQGEVFQDNFQIDFQNSDENPSKKFKPRRLYNVYQRQDPIFKNFTEDEESFLDYQQHYSSFSAELALIDKVMIQTIFLTRNISKNGYYEYFVRRNGQYFLEYMDDIIPVDGPHQQPLWGLSYNCPWEILLLKAWIKEKGGIGGVLHAEPAEFLYAFGLPGYSVKNIRKQLQFLKRQNSDIELKKKKQSKLAINKSEFNIFGKTRSDDKIGELGLIKNCLGYKITPIRPSKSLISGKTGQRTIYKVRSTIPSKWIGSLSVINKNERLEDYDFKSNPFNLEKEFLCTEEEILSIFSKFYLARDYYKSYTNNIVYQDSYVVDNAQKDIPYVYKLKVHENGFLNLNIQHKQSSKRAQFIKGYDRVRWPYIKYFLARVEPKKSEMKSKIATEHGIPGDFEPNLFKYSYWDIQFMKGYHRSVNRFMDIKQGEYLLYVKIQNLNKGVPQIDYTINLSSSAKLDEMYLQDMNPFQLRQLVDSTIFDYSKIHGQKYIRSSMQYIYLGNSFREIGFGFMALEIRQPGQRQLSKMDQKDRRKINPTEQQLGIRILPGKFNKLTLAGYYYQERDGTRSRLQQSHQPITMVSALGNPKIIVLENPNYDFQLTDEFPEPSSIEVYSMKKKK